MLNSGFSFAQSSQLFINCCFALSLSGSIYLLGEAFDGQFEKLLCLPISVFLVSLVWRQYGVYYIPLQYHYGKPESALNEATTLAVTLALASVPLVCLYLPAVALVMILVVIFLSLLKVRQMIGMLNSSGRSFQTVLDVLKDLRFRLWIYVFIATALAIVLGIFSVNQQFTKLWSMWSSVFLGVVPLLLYFPARWLCDNWFGSHASARTSAEDYVKALENAFSNEQSTK